MSPAEMRSAEGRVGGHIGNHWESLGMIHAISSFPGRLKDKLGIGSSETFRTCASHAMRCNTVLHAVHDLHHFVSIG